MSFQEEEGRTALLPIDPVSIVPVRYKSLKLFFENVIFSIGLCLILWRWILTVNLYVCMNKKYRMKFY